MKQNGFENLDEETLQQFSSVFKHFMGVNDDEVPFVDLHVFIRVPLNTNDCYIDRAKTKKKRLRRTRMAKHKRKLLLVTILMKKIKKMVVHYQKRS